MKRGGTRGTLWGRGIAIGLAVTVAWACTVVPARAAKLERLKILTFPLYDLSMYSGDILLSTP